MCAAMDWTSSANDENQKQNVKMFKLRVDKDILKINTLTLLNYFIMKKLFLALMVAMLSFSASSAQRVSPSAVQDIVAERGYASQSTIRRSGLIYMGVRNGNEYHYGIDVRVKGKNFYSQSDRAVYLKVKSYSPYAAFIYFKNYRDASRFYDGLDKTPIVYSRGGNSRRSFVVSPPVLKDGWWMIDLVGYAYYKDRDYRTPRKAYRR